MKKSILAALLCVILLGCTSQVRNDKISGEQSNLQDQYDKLKNDYATLQLKYDQLQKSDQVLNTTNKKIILDYNKSNSEYQNFILRYNSLSDNYNKLLTDNAQLRSLFNNLTVNYNDLMNKFRNFQTQNGRLPKDIVSSPSIPNLDFLLTKNSFILKYHNLNLSSVTDTKSMNPSITAQHTAIFTTSFDSYSLQKGNIIAYKSSSFDIPIMHRIIDIDNSNGLCYILQGDNNPNPDPECVKPSQIIGLVVGVIFNTVPSGYLYCQPDNIAIVKNDKFLCLSDNLPAGIYINNQTLSNNAINAFPFCSDKQSDKPYTVVTPDKKVYCYSYVS